MQGTPRQVFSRADELTSINLDIPQITKLFLTLRSKGINIDPSIYTVEQAKAAILSLKGGQHRA